MKKLSTFLALAVLLALVVPAGAGWVDLTTNFQAAGFSGNMSLITDTSTGTLYGIQGNAIRSYDASTDAWTDLMASTYGGATAYTRSYYVGGNFYLKDNGAFVQVYDIANDSWSKTDMPVAPSGGYAHQQGSTYDTQNGLLHCMQTIFPAGGGEVYAVASLDVATGFWSSVTEYAWPTGYAHYGASQSVTVGTVNYIGDATGQNLSMKMYDFNSAPTVFPEGTTARTATGDVGDNLSQVWSNQFEALIGTDIYVTGGDLSRVFAVYHTTTDKWEVLDDQIRTSGAYRNHSSAAVGSVVYVQSGGTFYAYDTIPEPATMSLLVIGGVGLLIRRRRS